MGPYPDATAVFDIDAIGLTNLVYRLNHGLDPGNNPIGAGIWPLVSLRNAEFLANEVPGVSVPETVLARMKQAQDKGKEAALAEGVAIAREMFQQVKGAVQGIQVSAPFGRVEVALEVFGG